MLIDGNNGPRMISVFTCDGCKYLSEKMAFYNTGKPYICTHDKKLKRIPLGEIGIDKITPDDCPFIFNKTRNEKLNRIS